MINIKRTYRFYTGLGLQLRNKTAKRRVKAKLLEDRCPTSQPNQTWAMGFVHDQLAMGKKIRVMTAVDIFSKFSPVVDPRFSYRAEDVVMTLERVCDAVGYARHVTQSNPAIRQAQRSPSSYFSRTTSTACRCRSELTSSLARTLGSLCDILQDLLLERQVWI